MRFVLLGLLALGIYYSALATRESSLSVRVEDAAIRKPTPVRVKLTDAQGDHPKVKGALGVSESALGIPAEAIAVMYGRSDKADGYLLQPDGSFYVDGSFDLKLPPGRYTLALSKGSEYLRQKHTLDVRPGARVSRTFRLERWIDMPARGWYSSDDHIHLRRSVRDNHAIVRWLAAEDVHVGHLLQMGDFWGTFFTQYGFGREARFQEDGYHISPGQEEPRTPEIGHTISLGAEQFVRFQEDYYSYGRVFDRVHELGGITGFAHQAMTFHGERGMVLNVLRGKIDFLELMQFCAAEGPLATKHYYRFLDMGYRLTALAGSDFPWCGRGPRFGVAEGGPQIGDARFYTYVGGPLAFEPWLQAVKAGRTFVSTGPMLEFTVNGQLPGSTVDVARGGRLKISAKAFGDPTQAPLEELEIVAHGETIKRARVGEPGQSAELLSLEMEFVPEHGLWVAARAEGGATQRAHTTPVYVTVEGGGFKNPKTLAQHVAECENALVELEQELLKPGNRLDNQAFRHRVSLTSQIAEARALLARLRSSGNE